MLVLLTIWREKWKKKVADWKQKVRIQFLYSVVYVFSSFVYLFVSMPPQIFFVGARISMLLLLFIYGPSNSTNVQIINAPVINCKWPSALNGFAYVVSYVHFSVSYYYTVLGYWLAAKVAMWSPDISCVAQVFFKCIFLIFLLVRFMEMSRSMTIPIQ